MQIKKKKYSTHWREKSKHRIHIKTVTITVFHTLKKLTTHTHAQNLQGPEYFTGECYQEFKAENNINYI